MIGYSRCGDARPDWTNRSKVRFARSCSIATLGSTLSGSFVNKLGHGSSTLLPSMTAINGAMQITMTPRANPLRPCDFIASLFPCANFRHFYTTNMQIALRHAAVNEWSR
jgi:hypothetical protein